MPEQPDLSELINVILELSKDHQKVEAFRRDPAAYLTQAGVSDELKRLMTSGRRSVEAAVRGSGRAQPAVVVVVIVIIIVITPHFPFTEED